MSSYTERTHPGQVFGRRVEEARKGRRWTQEKLAAQLRALGVKSSRATIAKLEGRGTRATLARLEDLFAIAAALGIPPVHLITPLDDQASVAITPKVTLPASSARAWIRGEIVLPLIPDVDLRQIPVSELQSLVLAELSRDMSPLARELAADGLAAAAARIADEIHNPKEEDTDG